MATQTAALPSRADIFRQGLTDARGRITHFTGSWGRITLDGERIRYHFKLSAFPEIQRDSVIVGAPVIFSARPLQIDYRAIRMPAGSRRPDPLVSAARLVNFHR